MGTVNRGIEWSGDDDVILLNSDALLGKHSVSILRRAAYAEPKIATATPFSNNASIYSIPRRSRGLDLEGSMEVLEAHSLGVSKLAPEVIEMPVGHGFCLFIRRSAIDAVGAFDEVAFGHGYSEEVDFCLRIRASGFYNVLATQAYVGHVGGVSFAESADTRRAENQKIIRKRFPAYFSEVREFMRNDPLQSLRDAAESTFVESAPSVSVIP